MVKKSSYSEKDIQHFTGLEGIRAKPEMYIGPTDDSGIFTLLRECLDNAVDEFLAGRNDRVTAFFSPKKNEFWVVDNGEGIPVGKHAKSGKSTLELVLTETHAGGKFGGTAYEKGSVGSHGVGGKAVTALSLEYEIFTCRSNKWYGMSFAKGKIIEGVAASSSPTLPNGKKPKQGTVIHYTPDPEIFGKHKLPLADLLSWAEITCYMNPGFRAVLINMDTKETKEFYSKEGPIELVRQKATKLKAELEDIFTFSSPLVEIAVAFSDAEGSHLSGYTNGLHNGHGGSHVETLGQALKETIAEWSKAKDAFTPALLLEGAIGLVNIKIPSPKFSSQTKEYLADPRGENFYEELVTALQKFWKAHKDLARTIIDRANQLKELQASVRASKQLIMKLKPKRGKTGLPTKLMSSIRCKPEDRELFIVEGESAAGNARFARDQQYQEVLPLKGKIVNLMKREGLESEEIINILKSIGYNPQEKDPLDTLRVGRILLMADADADGPLKGDTKVLLLDGTRPTIKELAERWEKDPTPFWVYARDSLDNLIFAPAILPRVTNVVTQLVRITLNNGHVFECSLYHKWMCTAKTAGLSETRVTWFNEHPYIPAKDLQDGDILNSIGIIRAGHSYQDSVVVVTNIDIVDVEETPVYCLTVPEYGNFMVDDGYGNGVCSANCHINTLLLTLFASLLPSIFSREMIYVVDAPEYVVDTKKGVFFGSSLEDLRKQLGVSKLPSGVRHLKGWGEASRAEMEVIGFNRATRKLIKISPPDKKQMAEFKRLMSEDPEYRKELLGV